MHFTFTIVFDFWYVVFVQYVNLYSFGTKTPDELVCSASHVFLPRLHRREIVASWWARAWGPPEDAQ